MPEWSWSTTTAGGGGEFRLYDNAADKNFGEEADLHIAAAGHHGAARAWVESMGWDYIEVKNKQDLLDNADRFVSNSSSRPIFMEVFTTMQDDSDGVRIIRDANTHAALRDRLLGRLPVPMMRAIPRPIKQAAKKLLGR